MKYQITYWLLRGPTPSPILRHPDTYKMEGSSHLCLTFVLGILGHAPDGVKLTLSPFKRRGYTEAKWTDDVGLLVWVGEYGNPVFHRMEKSIRLMPTTFWFKLEEWK